MDSNEHNRLVDPEAPLPSNESVPQSAHNSALKDKMTPEMQEESMATSAKKTPIVIDLTADNDEDKSTQNEAAPVNKKKNDQKPIPNNLPLTASNGPVKEVSDPEHLRRIIEYEERLDREEEERAKKAETAKKEKAAARIKRR